MDCYSNDAGCRGDCSRSRRPQSYRQNNSCPRPRSMGNYNISARNDAGMARTGYGRSSSSSDNCGCRECSNKDRGCLTDVMRATERMPLGMSYTPYQEFGELYEWDTAFCQGTLFCALDKPFLITNCPQGGIRR